MTTLFPDSNLPLVIHADRRDMDLLLWATQNLKMLEEKLLHHGALLFRGFGKGDASRLEEFIRRVSGEPLPYMERSSPRHQVNGRIYTSTEQPANLEIFLHNENSYQTSWPMKIFFMSVQQAQTGGETPIADCRKVLKAIDPAFRDKFQQKGFRIVRNFNQGMGIDWQTVFNTDNPDAVDDYCQENNITTQWLGDGALRTTAIRFHPIARHPKTGEETWFNHGIFFHVTTLGAELSETLLSCLEEDELPSNTYYGDGEPIEPEVLENIRNAYRGQSILFAWEEGDLLVLDNMLTAHGRSSFTGERRVLVGMADPITRQELFG